MRGLAGADLAHCASEGQGDFVGAIDVASEKVETEDDVAGTIREALKFADLERIQPCTNCGMAPLPRAVAEGKLRALGAGASLMRAQVGRG